MNSSRSATSSNVFAISPFVMPSSPGDPSAVARSTPGFLDADSMARHLVVATGRRACRASGGRVGPRKSAGGFCPVFVPSNQSHARPRLVAAAASQLFASPRFLSVLSASARPVARPQASSPLMDVSTKATTPENLREINRPPGSRGPGCGPARTPIAIKRNRLNRRSNRKTPAKNSHFRGPRGRDAVADAGPLKAVVGSSSSGNSSVIRHDSSVIRSRVGSPRRPGVLAGTRRDPPWRGRGVAGTHEKGRDESSRPGCGSTLVRVGEEAASRTRWVIGAG